MRNELQCITYVDSQEGGSYNRHTREGGTLTETPDIAAPSYLPADKPSTQTRQKEVRIKPTSLADIKGISPIKHLTQDNKKRGTYHQRREGDITTLHYLIYNKSYRYTFERICFLYMDNPHSDE